MSRPCKLQINTAGAWRDVLRFDLDAVDVEAMQVAAENLMVIADPLGVAKLRIAKDDGLQTSLILWTAQKGWK